MWKKLIGAVFGSGGDGIVKEVSDTVDKWIPSATTKHQMNIEDQTAGDSSQESARAMAIPSHSTWFDAFVDGVNRLVRPSFTVWVFGVLVGWWEGPSVGSIDPMAWNIIWTVVTFWFGSRIIFKDIPALVKYVRNK